MENSKYVLMQEAIDSLKENKDVFIEFLKESISGQRTIIKKQQLLIIFLSFLLLAMILGAIYLITL